MAARLRKSHQEDIKAKIQGTQLLRLLQDHALTGEFCGGKVDPSRIDAAKFLLNKIISNAPTDTTVAHSGEIQFGWLS